MCPAGVPNRHVPRQVHTSTVSWHDRQRDVGARVGGDNQDGSASDRPLRRLKCHARWFLEFLIISPNRIL